jgi:hypothetical protein
MSSAVGGPRVVNVAAGVESSEGPTPLRDARHEALEVLIGKWINEVKRSGRQKRRRSPS